MYLFLIDKVADYNVEVIYSGGDPNLHVMDSKGNELEVYKLEKFNQIQIADLLESKGFGKFKTD